MQVNEFAAWVAEEEGKKRQVTIAQISEILRVINKLTGGCLYAIIRLIS